MNLRLTFLPAIALLAALSIQAGSLEPPPGPVSPTRPPDTCYDNTGNRFVDCGDGTIKDTVTNLYWLKNANCFGSRLWADASKDAANLAHGQCGLTDGSLPGDWRLPTLGCPTDNACPGASASGEFGVLLNLAAANGCQFPSVPDTMGNGCWSEGDPFSGVQLANYWSSSVFALLPQNAWCAILNGGIGGADFKGSPFEVWPVRD
jgi:hypothetical protein